jgi:hypothetical protein
MGELSEGASLCPLTERAQNAARSHRGIVALVILAPDDQRRAEDPAHQAHL